jgi:UDP-2,4-diacetamido-2,4,6-trideoxy-beta-L-altropyranose hydrolase
MIVDHYELDVHFESAARAWAQSIVVIDDFPGRRHDCDILIDPTPGRLPLVYSGVVSKRAALLLGVEYYMVGEAFRLERPTALARRRQGKEARDLLIACGATDPSNLTRRALDELRDVAWASQITVVLSAAAPHLQSVRDAISHLQTRARLVVDASASEIAALYSSADLAIGAAGVSTYERCCLGLPTIMVVTADNQRDNAAATEAAGAVHFLGDARSMARGDLAKAVTALAGDPKRLRKMADSASALCDGAGADRVADIIRDRI